MLGSGRLGGSISGLSAGSSVLCEQMGYAGDYALVEEDGFLLWQSGECHISMVSINAVNKATITVH